MNPKQIKKLQARSRVLRAQLVSENVVAVTSRSQPPIQHFVTVEWSPEGAIVARCTCPWGMNGGACCSHVMAALNMLASRQERAISFWRDKDEAVRQKHRVLRVVGSTSDSAVFVTTRPAKTHRREALAKRYEEARGVVVFSIRPPSVFRALSRPSSGARYSAAASVPAN
ncbi:MAG TPA: SWIM zinc finger family protein [Candidatus Limnocylindrales bacterium]|nr:SWIM zinc finger family protein [Candidatus Limnocylindrales bacterium]